LGGSFAAADLGIDRVGVDKTLTGYAITDGTSDLRITLLNGDRVDLDLSDLDTVGDVLDAIEDAHASLLATLDAATARITITDLSSGSGTLSVTPRNNSLAAA
jgi:hypothetical protein